MMSLIYGQAVSKEFPILKGSYFGQKVPGTTPEVFMPQLFNIYKYIHGKLVFSPDGKEAFWVSTTTDENGEPVRLSLFMTQKKMVYGVLLKNRFFQSKIRKMDLIILLTESEFTTSQEQS